MNKKRYFLRRDGDSGPWHVEEYTLNPFGRSDMIEGWRGPYITKKQAQRVADEANALKAQIDDASAFIEKQAELRRAMEGTKGIS